MTSLEMFAQLDHINDQGQWETYLDRYQTNDESLVGLMSTVDSTDLIPSTFFAWNPDNTNRRLCVKITSQSAYYNASMEFDVTDEPRGFVELKWPTEFRDQLMRLRKHEVSILVLSGDDCGDANSYSVGSFYSDTKAEDGLTIWVRTDYAARLVVYDPSTNDEEKFICFKKSGQGRAAYNCKCILPRNYINNDLKISIEIASDKQGKQVRFIDLPLKL